jgi:hypothetical protein
MQNKISMLLGAAAVALGAGAGIADPFDNAWQKTEPSLCVSASACYQGGTAFQNGYSNGYRDGIILRQRIDRSGAGAKDNSDRDRDVGRGSYHLINI